MRKKLRVLIVEDSEDDTILLIRKLKDGGYNPIYERVDTDVSMTKALEKRQWDLIIADYAMPQFDGKTALKTFKKSELDIPFIIVSGTVGEEVAVKTMKDGAHDYLMKDKLDRLVPAIERELRDAATRRQQSQTMKVQASIYKISEAVFTTNDLQDLYYSIHNIIKELMFAENFYIALFDKPTRMFHFPYFIDEYDEMPGPKKPGKGATDYVIKTGEPLLGTPKVFDKLQKAGKIELIGEESISWLGVPLIIGNETIGAMVVQSYTKGIEYGENEKEILIFVSTQVAMAIERKRASDALRQSEDRYKVFINQISDGIYRLELEKPISLSLPVEEQIDLIIDRSYYAECNSALAKMYGLSGTDKMIGKKLSDFHGPYKTPEDKEGIRQCILANYKISNRISREKDKQGKIKYFSNTTIGIIENNQLVRLWGTQSDITQRKLAEEQIQKDLKEKEVMLKEIHHRVKNNLQIISSLLSLQSRNIKDTNILDLFKESQSRIRSMAMVHENLYQATDLAYIDFTNYINKLVNDLYKSYHISTKHIRLNLKIEDIKLPIDLAVPCGLIINELVSNALKYAFPSSFTGKGTISITLRHREKKEMEMIIKDNGIGMPENIDPLNTESLGLRLVNVLVQDQLEGSLKLTRKKGTSYQIQFKC